MPLPVRFDVTADGSTPSATPVAPLAVSGLAAVPIGATFLTQSSGNVAASAAFAQLTAVAGKTTYCTGFVLTGGGATAAAIVNPTLSGVLGGTMTFNFGAAAGATVMSTPLVVVFNPALPASAPNTTIQISMPSLGAGNTNATANITGYQA